MCFTEERSRLKGKQERLYNANMLCPKCSNPVGAGDKQCPYCLAPVGRTGAGAPQKTLAVIALAGAILVLGVAVSVIQRTGSSTSTDGAGTGVPPEAQAPVHADSSSPVTDPGAPAEFVPPSYVEENTLVDVYRNLTLAAEHDDHKRLRESLSRGAWAEIQKNGYDPLDYATSDIQFDNMKTVMQQENGDRGLLVFTGSSAIITDEKGNPASATGIYRLEREEGRWKLHSLVWHIHPPDDPVPEAVAWLNE